VPVAVFPPVTPFTCQLTAVLLVFRNIAVNCCVPPVFTVAKVGEIVMLTGAVIVTCAEADWVESACETAVTVIVAGFGTVPGAEY
jgi:hypothetical protein